MFSSWRHSSRLARFYRLTTESFRLPHSLTNALRNSERIRKSDWPQPEPHQEQNLSPSLQLRPELGEGSEFRALAKEDVNLFFQSVRVVSRGAHVLHVFPEAFENFSSVVEDNHAVAGVAARAPKKISLVATERGRQSLAAAKEIDGAGLAVVLGEDAAVPALGGGDAIPGDSSFVGDFFPAELVRVPLGEGGTGVGVFHDRELERKIFRVGQKAVRRKNRHHHRGKMCSAGQQDEHDGQFQPSAMGADVLRAMNRGFNHDSAGGQQHGINRSEVVVLAVEHEKGRVADHIAPAQRAVGLELHGKQQSEKSHEPDRGGEGIHKQRLLEEVGKRPQHHAAAFSADSPNKLKERPVVPDVPEHIGKADEEGSHSPEPDPFVEEDSALLPQQQSDDDAEAEESDGVFLFKANPSDNAKPEPVSWIISLDRQDGEVGATHPQVGFETVCP